LNKPIKFTLLFLISFFVSVAFLHFIGITNIGIELLRKIYRDEVNISLIRIMASSIVLMVILFSCLIASGMAQKKGRNRMLWIIICIFINAWGVLILHFLPSQKGTYRR